MEKRIHLLLVDDEPLIQSYVASMVRRMGYDVSVAETGAEAVELARDVAFDAAIIDYRLPGMDGLETLAEIRRLRPGIAAILFSGAVTSDMVQRTREIGAHTLEKPFGAETLRALLQQVLS